MDKQSCTLIAEIGASHAGCLQRALMLTELAAQNGADVVKFQKRDPISSVPSDIANKPHPNPHFAYGDTYLSHRIALELSVEDHVKLKDKCNHLGVKYACSVWDLKSAKEIININPFFIKIPSACNKHETLIDYCLCNFEKQIHISLGMRSLVERNMLLHKYSGKNVVFYHTTTEYPCPFEKLYIKEISKIVELYGTAGFSNHGYGIASDIAALALGASYIERHFIDDRTFRHTDAAASLEPRGLSTLKRDLQHISLGLQYRPHGCTEEEARQALKLRNSEK
jgi:N-acetylneuraminate synthase